SASFSPNPASASSTMTVGTGAGNGQRIAARWSSGAGAHRHRGGGAGRVGAEAGTGARRQTGGAQADRPGETSRGRDVHGVSRTASLRDGLRSGHSGEGEVRIGRRGACANGFADVQPPTGCGEVGKRRNGVNIVEKERL